MSLNMKTLTQALAKTAAVIEKTVQTTVQEVTGPKALQDYELLDQIGSGGPALAWKLYSAKPRPGTPSQYPIVCVWILDKRALSDARARAGLSKTAEDAFFDIVRADAARLVRLRHPGVVHVVQALDESKHAMAMVTEPLFASVANGLGFLDNIAKLPKELKGMEMGLLEIKHGLLQISESLDFIHSNAKLIHRAISPETVFITSTGAWKLAGFGFAISVDQASADSNNIPPFHYSEYDVEDSVLPLQPSLNYIAPEFVRSRTHNFGCSSDMFSFGCLAYHLVARKPLLDCNNNVKMYMNTLNYLSHEAFSDVPSDLAMDLKQMLSEDEASRPTASDFTGSSFFRDDTRLRALRFLDHMLERDNMQKSEFLKALSDMWKEFDSRVLRYKVLPPLCAELRNLVMQPMILPMVLTIAESQDKNDFELSTLPALVPVFNSAAGETLLLLVKHAELIINKARQEYLIAHVLPLLLRAYDDTDVRMQEEVLRKTGYLAKQLDTMLVKESILPRVHGLALKTTVAAVRVNALLCLSELVHTLDKRAILDILQTLQRCTAVDRSAPTLMCTLGIANSIFKQFGTEFTAEHVLPLLMPLLTAQQLNVQQFAKFMLFVKDVLRKIEEKRGVSISDGGTSEVKFTPSINGLQSESSQRASGVVSSSTWSCSTWDEDWVSTAKGPSTRTRPESNLPTKTSLIAQPSSVTANSLLLSISSAESTVGQQTAVSCPAVDIEWPSPAPSSGFLLPLSGGSEKPMYNARGAADATLDEMDPFADWPPRSSNSIVGIGSSINSSGPASSIEFNSGWNWTPINNNPIGLSTQNHGKVGLNVSCNQGSVGPASNNVPIGLLKQSQGSSSSNFSVGSSKLEQGNNSSNGIGLGLNSSIGSKMNQANTISGIGNSVGGASNQKQSADLGSIFVSSKTQHQAPKLAPPPATAGRGRGRPQGQLAVSRPRQAKKSPEQPSLLDLL